VQSPPLQTKISVVTYRDIGQFPIPHVTEEWMDAADSLPDESTIDTIGELFLSNELVD
jgi:FMN-dependent NADH-azoreductase